MEIRASSCENGTNDNISNVVNGDSYTTRAARTTGSINNIHGTIRHLVLHVVDNDMPKCPKSALFTPSHNTSARSVFQALSSAEINASEIQCLQRKMNDEVVITFNSPAAKEKFLSLNALKIQNESYAIQDIDRPLTFLTIYDTPFELSDLAIIKRLPPYCDVVNYQRGRFNFMPGVYNGLHH